MSRRPALHCGIFCVYLGAYAGVASAQLPSVESSPLNRLGRVLGIGYSDGYHECPEPDCQPTPVMTYEVQPSLPPAAVSPPAEQIPAQLYEQASTVPQRSPRTRRSLQTLLPVSSSTELHATPDISGGRGIGPEMGSAAANDGASLYRQPMPPVDVRLTQPSPLPAPAAPPLSGSGRETGSVSNEPHQAVTDDGTAANAASEPPPAKPEDARSLIDLEPGQHPGEISDYDSRMSTQSSSRRSAVDALRRTPAAASPTLPRQDVGLETPPGSASAVDLPEDAVMQEASPSDADRFEGSLEESWLPSEVAPQGGPAVAPEIPAAQQPVEPTPSESPAAEDLDLLLPKTLGATGLTPRQMPQSWGRLPGPPHTGSGPVNRYRLR